MELFDGPRERPRTGRLEVLVPTEVVRERGAGAEVVVLQCD